MVSTLFMSQKADELVSCPLASGWVWPFGEMEGVQKEGGGWSGGLHFLGSLPAGCCCRLQKATARLWSLAPTRCAYSFM